VSLATRDSEHDCADAAAHCRFYFLEVCTPLLARIVGIAQAFDELTAEKSERTALPINEALEQIEQQAGTAFDPTLAELFCRTMREQPPQQ
jgi:HD domain-containing protein